MTVGIENCVTNETTDKTSDNHHKPQHLTIAPVFKVITDYNGLNDLESNRISELLMACNVFHYPLSKNIIEVKDRLNTLMDLGLYATMINSNSQSTDDNDKSLSAIALFNPNRPNLRHRQSIK
ncbi:unnamed protein product [Oppiella nova]|uniref:Uncharacterized protein n=1 Tax=Oppiella nova TaxID=334625 RepID=A0A7R9QAY5_9ACAR|nr:unnamed protein product [Oppiella nova]CAG2162125.1 unnamed protein product [Oppiella nova]